MSETGLNSTEILPPSIHATCVQHSASCCHSSSCQGLSHQVLTLYFPMNWTIITINKPTMICEGNYYFIIICIVYIIKSLLLVEFRSKYKNCILVMLRMITALCVGILNYKYFVFIDPERNLECCVFLLNMTLCTLLWKYNIKQYLPIFNHNKWYPS